MSDNPYQTPVVSEVSAAAVVSDAERIRRELLSHETSLKGMGGVLFLGAVFMLVLVGFGLVFSSSLSGSLLTGLGGPELLVLLLVAGVCVLQLVVWWGLRKLSPWVKVPAIIVACLMLIGFPIGTILAVFFLYLLLGRKGQMVLSPAYQEVLAETPHVKYRTPLWLWILLIVIVAVVIGAMVFAVG